MNIRLIAERFFMKYLGGHISIGPVTIYGYNAMRWAINVKTQKFGSICFRPTTVSLWGDWHRWYFFVSPNGTPWASTYAIGPGIDKDDKFMASIRRYSFGHNFNTDGDFSDWNRKMRDYFENIRWQNIEKKHVIQTREEYG